MYKLLLFLIFIGFCTPPHTLAAPPQPSRGCEPDFAALYFSLKGEFSLIEPGLHLSGTPRSADALTSKGIDSILAVSHLEECPYLENPTPGIEVRMVSLIDGTPTPLPYLTAAVLELADLRTHYSNTLIHCKQGMSRSASITALYLMAQENITWNRAFARLKILRPIVDADPYLTSEFTRNRAVEIISFPNIVIMLLQWSALPTTWWKGIGTLPQP